jgi:hypothetical protein
VVVLLRPSPEPQLPLARLPTYGQGWHPPTDDGVRWAFEDAVMSYYNPFDGPITVDLRLSLLAIGPRQLTLMHEAQPVGAIKADHAPQELRVPALVLAPGVNRFRLESDEPAARQGSGRYQLRSFGLAKAWVGIRAAPQRPEVTPD